MASRHRQAAHQHASNASEFSEVYDSSDLSVSSSPSNRVRAYLKEHGIDESHIDKHFRFKSIKKSRSGVHLSSEAGGYTTSIAGSVQGHSVQDADDESEDVDETASSSEDEEKQPSRTTRHHWWTRMTIQCVCCGIGLIEFSWTIIECLVIPYLLLWGTPSFAISWILLFIPLFDAWMQPLMLLCFNRIMSSHKSSFYYVPAAIVILTILLVIGFVLIPDTNVVTAKWRWLGALNFEWTHPDPFRWTVSAVGYIVLNLSLGFLLIPLRFLLNDAMAKISTKGLFTLRKRTMNSIYRRRYILSKRAEQNYMASFDEVASQIYNIDEFNHYLGAIRGRMQHRKITKLPMKITRNAIN